MVFLRRRGASMSMYLLPSSLMEGEGGARGHPRRCLSQAKKDPARKAQIVITITADAKPGQEKPGAASSSVKSRPWNRLFMKLMNGPGAASQISVQSA